MLTPDQRTQAVKFQEYIEKNKSRTTCSSPVMRAKMPTK